MTRSRTFRTEAIILKRRDFGEADRLVTLLTPKHGKVDAIAKGARKPTSKKTGHVELFAHVDVLVSRGRELGILTQAELIDPFGFREDLQRMAYANYVAELLDKFTFSGDLELHELFQLLHITLERLSGEYDLQLVLRYYEMRLLDLAGFRPELSQCIIGRDTIKAEDQYFSYEGGGIVAPQNAHQVGHLIPISMRTLKLLRHLQRSEYRHIQALDIPVDLQQALERVMLGYITYLLESKLQSVDFIQHVRRQNS